MVSSISCIYEQHGGVLWVQELLTIWVHPLFLVESMLLIFFFCLGVHLCALFVFVLCLVYPMLPVSLVVHSSLALRFSLTSIFPVSVCPMLPVSLYCRFLLARSVFSYLTVFKEVIRTEDRGLLTCLLENVDFMFSLLHVYLYNLYNCHKLYCLITITFWIELLIWYCALYDINSYIGHYEVWHGISLKNVHFWIS